LAAQFDALRLPHGRAEGYRVNQVERFGVSKERFRPGGEWGVPVRGVDVAAAVVVDDRHDFLNDFFVEQEVLRGRGEACLARVAVLPIGPVVSGEPLEPGLEGAVEPFMFAVLLGRVLLADYHSLSEAESRVPEDSKAREQFIADFVALQGVWEFLYANNTQNPMLDPFKADYRWLAKVFDYIAPTDKSNALLWEKHGAKTLALIHGHMENISVSPGRTVKLDAAGLALVKKIAEQLAIPGTDPIDPKNPGDVYQQVLDSIEARLKRRLEGGNSTVYKSLAERIEKLRQRAITTVDDSIQFLEDCLNVARDVVAADRAVEAGEPLVDPRTGALTAIVRENSPEGLHKIVPDFVFAVDTIVVDVAYAGWKENDRGDRAVKKELRARLKKFGFPIDGDLFDKVYAYVRENY
jgi:type I restriction enzyme R subunit